jgi:hypothetical protein
MRKIAIVMTVGMALATAAAPTASAAPTVTIDFGQDDADAVPDGFHSTDSASVSFRDSRGHDLEIGDFGRQSHGNALATYGDDPSALIIDIRHPVRSISLWFGNDDPGWTRPGDRAVLTVFRGPREIGSVSVRLNRNDRMDQSIAYEGHPFDRAVFLYDVDRRGGLIEIVDDITIAPLTS